MRQLPRLPAERLLGEIVKARREPNGLIVFRCPACATDSKKTGLHALDNRWKFNGDFNAPTFDPSVAVTMEFGDGQPTDVCHSYVVAGRIQYLGDCTHSMRGKTADLPEIE